MIGGYMTADEGHERHERAASVGWQRLAMDGYDDREPAKQPAPERPAEPCAEWRIEAPGLIVLPGTGYRIDYQPDRGSHAYVVTWRGYMIGGGPMPSLDWAKREAAQHMRNMISMGIEP